MPDQNAASSQGIKELDIWLSLTKSHVRFELNTLANSINTLASAERIKTGGNFPPYKSAMHFERHLGQSLKEFENIFSEAQEAYRNPQDIDSKYKKLIDSFDALDGAFKTFSGPGSGIFNPRKDNKEAQATIQRINNEFQAVLDAARPGVNLIKQRQSTLMSQASPQSTSFADQRVEQHLSGSKKAGTPVLNINPGLLKEPVKPTTAETGKQETQKDKPGSRSSWNPFRRKPKESRSLAHQLPVAALDGRIRDLMADTPSLQMSASSLDAIMNEPASSNSEDNELQILTNSSASPQASSHARAQSAFGLDALKQGYRENGFVKAIKEVYQAEASNPSPRFSLAEASGYLGPDKGKILVDSAVTQKDGTKKLIDIKVDITQTGYKIKHKGNINDTNAILAQVAIAQAAINSHAQGSLSFQLKGAPNNKGMDYVAKMMAAAELSGLNPGFKMPAQYSHQKHEGKNCAEEVKRRITEFKAQFKEEGVKSVHNPSSEKRSTLGKR